MTRLPLKHPGILLATWFGAGYLNPAPGTWGSLATLPFIIIVFMLSGIWGAIAFTIAVTVIGFWASAAYDQKSNQHDSKEIVIDEVAGQSIALLPVLYWAGLSSLLLIIAGFLLFRLFDILKPWPVSYCDKNIKGAAGVMLDDIVAGIFAAGCLIGLIYAGIG